MACPAWLTVTDIGGAGRNMAGKFDADDTEHIVVAGADALQTGSDQIDIPA